MGNSFKTNKIRNIFKIIKIGNIFKKINLGVGAFGGRKNGKPVF
jgi:hypothetical protein